MPHFGTSGTKQILTEARSLVRLAHFMDPADSLPNPKILPLIRV